MINQKNKKTLRNEQTNGRGVVIILVQFLLAARYQYHFNSQSVCVCMGRPFSL